MLRLFVVIAMLCLPLSALAQDTVFEVETLNEGLADPQLELDIFTPQTAVETFLSAASRGDFETAAHVLNLNDFDPRQQPVLGPALAEKLDAIIDRKLVISWQALLERPDALDANAPSENPMAGQARRSLLLGVLELDNRSVAIRLNRVQPKDGAAVWVFSRQSVDLIDPLFQRYGPSELEKALPDVLRAKGLFGLYWWELIGLPLLCIATFFAAMFTWRALTRISKRFSDSFVNGIVRGLRLPLTLFVLGGVMWGATNYIFIVSGILSNIMEPLIVMAFVAGVIVLAVNVIDAFLDRVMIEEVEDLTSPEHEDRRARATTVLAVRRMVVVIAVLVGVGVTLTTARVFQTLGFSLLAGAGALTLVVGVAAREALGNILGSMQISLNRSARVGDQLIFRDTLCTVERIHFTFVQLKVWDGTRMVVPVLDFIQESFINRTLVENPMIRNVVLTLSPMTDVAALREHYENWARNDDRIEPNSKLECYVTGQDEYGMKVRFLGPITDPRNGWDVECELREEMIKAAREQESEDALELLPHLGTTSDKQRDDFEEDDEAA